VPEWSSAYTYNVTSDPFALYVHIPFCTAKCTYCDFNSYAGQDSLMAPYAEAVSREAALWSPAMRGRRVSTVFFGGGTPSLLPLEHMTTIVHAIRDQFAFADGAEVTLEANPGTVDGAHLRGLHDLGFNRISFGVQSFHDDELRSLDRIHDATEVDDAYRWAREAGFGNVNLDLIYGLQGQNMAGWQENLERALAMGPEHLSLYALTLEDGTPMTRDVERGRIVGPDLDLQADMFEWSRERLRSEGFEHYEVSNWARDGRQCRHNLAYWHNETWLGLGAGAHSHVNNERFSDVANPRRYIELVNETWKTLGRTELGSKASAAKRTVSRTLPEALDGRGAVVSPVPVDSMRQVTFREPPENAREMAETVILALRLREGLHVPAFERRFGVSLDSVYGDVVRETLELGLTELLGDRLRLRDEAVMVGDEAFLRFLPEETHSD
jgi:oxygen-independent coproporphyrinogen III oxidase